MIIKIDIKPQHRLFAILFCVTMFILALDQSADIPTIFRKVKYIYIAVVGWMSFSNLRIKRDAGASLTVLALLTFHAVLFGYVLVNRDVLEAIHDNTEQTLIYLATVTVTFVYIYRNKLFRLFVDLSYVVLSAHMFLIMILYHSQIANPIWSIRQAFFTAVRYRAELGFVHPGFLSNHMFLILVFSIIFWEIHKDEEPAIRNTAAAYVLLVSACASVLLISAAERTGIICAFMVLFLYLWFRFVHVNQQFYLVMTIGLIVLFLVCWKSGIVAKVWSVSHRDLNLTANYPVFKQLGNIWTGMGFVESAGFQKEINVFHAPTSALDLYYVYIYFSTGIIGCVILGAAYLLIFYRTVKGASSLLGKLLWSVYASMLFMAFWNSNLFIYRYPSSTYFLVLMLCAVCEGKCMEE